MVERMDGEKPLPELKYYFASFILRERNIYDYGIEHINYLKDLRNIVLGELEDLDPDEDEEDYDMCYSFLHDLEEYIIYLEKRASVHKVLAEDTYEVTYENTIVTLKPSLAEVTSGYEDLHALGISRYMIDEDASTATYCQLHGPEFYIVLKIYILTLHDGNKRRIMYIGDYYVNDELRNQGIGTQLQNIAEQIAAKNKCDTIFGRLIAENPYDQGALEEHKRKKGFEIVHREGKRPMGVKRLDLQ